MTETELPERREGTRRPRPWLRWVAPVVGLVVLAAVVTWVVLDHFEKQYGPVESDYGSGIGGPGVVTSKVDESGPARLGNGSAYFYSMITNDGSHDVRATGVDRTDIVRAAAWAPFRFEDGVSFQPDRWRPFPATIPADGIIQVRVTVGRPSFCRHAKVEPDASAGVFYSGRYTLRWESLLSYHRLEYATAPDDNRLRLC